jgi:hypothetical protein
MVDAAPEPLQASPSNDWRTAGDRMDAAARATEAPPDSAPECDCEYPSERAGADSTTYCDTCPEADPEDDVFGPCGILHSEPLPAPSWNLRDFAAARFELDGSVSLPATDFTRGQEREAIAHAVATGDASIVDETGAKRIDIHIPGAPVNDIKVGDRIAAIDSYSRVGTVVSVSADWVKVRWDESGARRNLQRSNEGKSWRALGETDGETNGTPK